MTTMPGNGPAPSGRATYALMVSPLWPLMVIVSAIMPSYWSVWYACAITFPPCEVLAEMLGLNTCHSCKRGTLKRGVTTATFDAEGTTVVIRNIPADVCDSCGEGSFDPRTSERLLELAAA